MSSLLYKELVGVVNEKRDEAVGNQDIPLDKYAIYFWVPYIRFPQKPHLLYFGKSRPVYGFELGYMHYWYGYDTTRDKLFVQRDSDDLYHYDSVTLDWIRKAKAVKLG